MGDEILLTDENIPPMQDELFRLYSQGFLTDITLSCEDGKNFEAHRVLLAARSQYFYGIVPKLKVEPVIFLKGVKGSHLEKILKYIYSGSATVSRSQLKPILEVAKSLQVRGLQDLAVTELSRGTNTSVSGPLKYSGSKTSSPIPSKSKDDSFHRSSPSSQNAREIALQQQQKLYDKLSANLSTKRSPIKNSNSPLSDRSPLTYKSSNKRGRPPVKNLSARPVKSEENGEETFKFQYQYISDDSDEIDKDDSNDSDFELAAKRNQNQLAAKLPSNKRKRGRPPKSHEHSSPIRKKNFEKDDSDDGFDNIGKHSKSSSDDDSDNSSDDDLDNDPDDNESSDSESDADSDDQSDDGDNESPTRMSKSSSPQRNNKSTSPRRSGKETKVKKEGGGPSMDDYYDAPTPTPVRRGGRGPTINGKQILPVQCKGKRAELHLSKFGNGTNGKSIKYKGEWMTPEEYEQACGHKVGKYLESITTDYGPLKTLTASGLLKPHPKKCKCSVCMDEELTSPEVQKKVKREERKEEKKEDKREEKRDKKDNKMEIEKSKPKKREATPEVDETDGNSAKDLALKRKKKLELQTQEKEEPKQVKTPSQSQIVQKPNPPIVSSKLVSPKPSQPRDKPAPKPQEKSEQPSPIIPKSNPAITSSSPTKTSPSISKSEIISPPTLTTTKPLLTSPVTCTPSVSTQSSFSPSSSKPLASPSFIALSPATNMSPMTTITSTSTIAPSVVPFPSKLSGIPAPSPTTVSNFTYPTSVHTTHSPTPAPSTHSNPNTTASFNQIKVESRPASHAPPPTSKQQISIAMGPPKPPHETIQVMSSMPQTQQQLQMAQMAQNKTGQGRIGSVMQVRCKAVNALLYVNKYESGSKGKCILVGDDWMTPNEYEEKSGSKAKKYLSSIKCLGRPLRAYVNSGELRGTGPPPSPKPPKINKPKPPQPIAPAPAPGQSGPAYAIPPPMSPAHMSAGMPQSLTQVAMMSGGSVGQPIMLSQSNLAVSMAGSSMNQVGPILQPMTFTFAPMSAMQGQQLQHQQLQHQQLHGTTVAQQIHGSTDYILQHK